MDWAMDSVGWGVVVAVEQQVVDRIEHLTITDSLVGRYERLMWIFFDNLVALERSTTSSDWIQWNHEVITQRKYGVGTREPLYLLAATYDTNLSIYFQTYFC